MGLTITKGAGTYGALFPVEIYGRHGMKVLTGTVKFDDSYPTGGESMDISAHFTDLLGVAFESKAGYLFEYDYENKKLKAYGPTGAHTLNTGASAAGAAHTHAFTGSARPPALVVEEAVTVTSNQGTLAHVPLYIVAVQATAGTVTGAFKVIPNGETPATKQVAVNFTTGALTFLGTDAVTAAKVTYIPKRDSGYLSAVTVDEAVTASSSKANLAARAGLIQYVWDDTDGVLVDFEQPGTSPSATHFCTVDINDSGDTSIESHSADHENTLKVTYVPFDQIPPGCFVDDADIALSSEAYSFTGDGGYPHVLVPGFGVNIIGETGAAARSAAVIQGPSGTAADGVATWNPATNKVTTDQSTAMTIMSMPWMILDPAQLTPMKAAGTNANESSHTHAYGTLGVTGDAAAAEVTNESDALADVEVRFFAWGY